MGELSALEGSEFRAAFERILAGLRDDAVQNHAFVEVPSDQPPWFDSGLTLERGDRITALAAGRTHLTGTDISIGPAFQLWYRLGRDGEIFRGTRASHTFEAQEGGQLYVASYLPGEWGTKTGDLGVSEEVYRRATGGFSVVLVRWLSDPVEGLTRLAAVGDVNDLVATELDRLLHPVTSPDGWYYLWYVGPAEIYRPVVVPGKTAAIRCHTRRDCGLLLKDVAPLALRPETRLRWSWKVDVLPSGTAENTLPTHDYMSIAVEFDNGQDITYFWSAELPAETGFRCPIPTWRLRETHVVIRSGQQGLGDWLDEERDLYADYVKFVGGPAGARIVRVWLIALTLYQGNEGLSHYADISFVSDGRVIPV